MRQLYLLTAVIVISVQAAIAGYLGSNDSFDEALVEFANSYADQNEKDYEAFMRQIRSRKLVATEG